MQLTILITNDRKIPNVPIYRKGPTYNPENYRPISLTCICHKLLEHIVDTCIYIFTLFNMGFVNQDKAKPN